MSKQQPAARVICGDIGNGKQIVDVCSNTDELPLNTPLYISPCENRVAVERIRMAYRQTIGPQNPPLTESEIDERICDTIRAFARVRGFGWNNC